MRQRWMIASTLLLASCTMVQPALNRGTLILKPEITAGVYGTHTVLPNYAQSSIHHLILKLYTFDGSEHDQGIQKILLNSDLTRVVTFTSLKANTTYRIKALAYASTDDSNLISTSDANSYTDITLVTDDHPYVGSLKVKLIDRAFNGQGTGSISVSPGGYSYAASESWAVPYIVTTIAGNSNPGTVDGIGTAAQFNNPRGLALDGNGNLYLADLWNHTIRKIVLASGVVTTINGVKGSAGSSDGIGTAAKFNDPMGLVCDGAGNLYVADYWNHAIRKIALDTGVVTTIAGTKGASGSVDGTGTSASFNNPVALALDGSGNLYVADYANNAVRKVVLSSGVVTTLAVTKGATGSLDATGTSASFNAPFGLALDGNGNLFVTDFYNHAIRKIVLSTGVVSTLAGKKGLAGTADGTGTSASFNTPFGLTYDGNGNLYVADFSNHALRKVVVASGEVTTIAGIKGSAGTVDGLGVVAKFNCPNSPVLDSRGYLYVSDGYNNVIRRIQ